MVVGLHLSLIFVCVIFCNGAGAIFVCLSFSLMKPGPGVHSNILPPVHIAVGLHFSVMGQS